MSNSKAVRTSKHRLVSLDALRGFNMFWIIGAERIAHLLQKTPVPGSRFLAAQLTHSHWNGFTFYDFVFPMFLFIVGVSAVFAVTRQREQHATRHSILPHIFYRALKLFLLGILVSNINFTAVHGFESIRWMGVLQRIAICYSITACLILYCKPRWQAITTGVILLGYWLLMQLVPAPGHEAAIWNYPGANLANYLDDQYLPGRLYYGAWDPEGLLSTLPALATCLCGTLTGYWLKKQNRLLLRLPSLTRRPAPGRRVELRFLTRQFIITKERKALVIAAGGVLALGLGLLWGLVFPINKKIWTSSFALLTGGLSATLLSLFYWLFEIRGLAKWAFPFVVIGRNPIFIYLLSNLLPVTTIANWLIKKQYMAVLGTGQYLLVAGIVLLFEWSILYLMYRRKLYLRL